MRSMTPRLLSAVVLLSAWAATGLARDGSELWLGYRALGDSQLLEEYGKTAALVGVSGTSATCTIIREELTKGMTAVLGRPVRVVRTDEIMPTLLVATPQSMPGLTSLVEPEELAGLGDEGFVITRPAAAAKRRTPRLVIAANTDIGLLYGSFALLRSLQTQTPLAAIEPIQRPRIKLRLLDHWDNLDGSVERGYAGASLWQWDALPQRVNPRCREYARANASIGINGVVLNNVNADPAILRSEYLAKVARLAELFRPWGIRVFLSVNFASPLQGEFELEENRRGGIGELKTADPADPAVRAWWRHKAREICQRIPDFGGFLVKASSEGMPGPQAYGRSHAEGANMLAEALEPYGGVVMWRSFVYTPATDPDRAKRAYKEFVPLDGKFAPNVLIQAKNGPIDFQPREPVQPLFGALEHTPVLLELQITQEYLGHSTHLVFLAPMWREYLDFDTWAEGQGSTLARIVDGSLRQHDLTGIAGVANTGSDANWCGHLFAQANWYAFGRLAWDNSLSAPRLAEEWVRQTLSNDKRVVAATTGMMLGSWEACVDYMTPLGLHHIMQEGFHYGPQPDFADAREDWTSVYYHRADKQGIGFDRSSQGSGAVNQYAAPLARKLEDLRTCPERYLLWFHHVGWTYRMRSGRTLWEELCFRYERGVDVVKSMGATWQGLEGLVDDQLYRQVSNKLDRQLHDAAQWRDTCLGYFQRFSGKPIPPKSDAVPGGDASPRSQVGGAAETDVSRGVIGRSMLSLGHAQLR